VVGEKQQITREEAIRAFTINGAWALKMESEIGSIVVGKRADLIVLSGDLMACAQDDIKDLQVVLTMLDGQVVYRAS
jgi:predicted amidohydrolase YtcJ